MGEAGVTERYGLVGRAGWPSGPWDGEPDRVTWEGPHGLRCAIRRVPRIGHLCGYVRAPDDHPYHGVGYDDCPWLCRRQAREHYCAHTAEAVFRAHGGVTFSGADAALGKGWWLGFDAAHSGDLQPAILAALGRSVDGDDVYRDVAYMRGQCELLAEQLHEAGTWRGARRRLQRVRLSARHPRREPSRAVRGLRPELRGRVGQVSG